MKNFKRLMNYGFSLEINLIKLNDGQHNLVNSRLSIPEQFTVLLAEVPGVARGISETLKKNSNF